MAKFIFVYSWESIKMALQSLRANKLRSFLTTIGIVIGVTTVIAIVSIIQGANKAFVSQLSSLGSNTVYISKWPWVSGDEWWKYRNRKNITMENYQFLKERATFAEAVSVEKYYIKPIKFESESLSGVYVGAVDEQYEITDNIDPEYGRFFSLDDVHQRRPVCVIGRTVFEKLFKTGKNPIGEKIKIGDSKYTIVGILEKKGSMFGWDQDNRAFIPVGVFQRSSNLDWGGLEIHVKIPTSMTIDEAKDHLTELMRITRRLPYYKKDDFSINEQSTLTNFYKKLTTGLYATAIGIGLLSLVVGGIGIMNIMLVSVTERTKEIGIRKAIGAKKRNILIQFMIESVTISGVGGVIGILLGFIIAFVIDKMSPLPATISFWSVVLGIGFSSTVGIFFGIYPAAKAAKLDPIEALRYE